MSIYIRAKRKKTTLFMHVDPSDTILEVKQRIQELLQQAPDRQRLFKGTTQLEDSRKLADMQIGNDDVLAMTFCQADGSWEEIDITSFETEKDLQ
ncbi:hypothetical protein WJX84_003453 [Apatococcus fuscideae]|uniref:Ubiquitin-like domain-containing protein n=1 Tax=Apatococcus fuscideae TaxID=2026836 RepID=A0AAW1SRY0_9CHLO